MSEGYYKFSPEAQKEAMDRQNGCCAHCNADLGQRLRDGGKIEGHHVVPQQSGDPTNKDHDFIKSSDNCVYLCAGEHGTCHWRVHENGKTRDGATAPPEYFKYSHGDDQQAHEEWSQDLSEKSDALWRDKHREEYKEARAEESESTVAKDEGKKKQPGPKSKGKSM